MFMVLGFVLGGWVLCWCGFDIWWTFVARLGYWWVGLRLVLPDVGSAGGFVFLVVC